MARSEYIYVAMSQSGWPEAAFTVKHELRTWLKRQPLAELLQVFRYPDNPRPSSRPAAEMNIQEILNG